MWKHIFRENRIPFIAHLPLQSYCKHMLFIDSGCKWLNKDHNCWWNGMIFITNWNRLNETWLFRSGSIAFLADIRQTYFFPGNGEHYEASLESQIIKSVFCFPVAPNHTRNECGCNLAQIFGGRRLLSLEIDCDNDDDNRWMCSFYSRL